MGYEGNAYFWTTASSSIYFAFQTIFSSIVVAFAKTDSWNQSGINCRLSGANKALSHTHMTTGCSTSSDQSLLSRRISHSLVSRLLSWSGLLDAVGLVNADTVDVHVGSRHCGLLPMMLLRSLRGQPVVFCTPTMFSCEYDEVR